MKKLLLTLIASMIGSTSLYAVPTYALKCRPGSNTAFNISVAQELRFGFAKAPVAAGPTGANLQPGQCAWADRPLSASEPAYVVVPFVGDFKVGAVVPHASNNGFKGYTYASNKGWVYEFATKDTILTVYAYNDGQYLRVPNP